jgi:hypothetical protein
MPGPSIDLQQVLVSDALAARGAHAVLRLKLNSTILNLNKKVDIFWHKDLFFMKYRKLQKGEEILLEFRI